MGKPKFNTSRIERFLQKVYPRAKIKKFEQFSTGLVSPTFKVEIINPTKILVVKLGKLKHKNKTHQNNKILKYLNENNIPAPKVLLDGTFDGKFITIMGYCPGSVASKVYEKGDQNLRQKILFDAGKDLKKIHTLEIPPFWIHQHHEIKNKKEWKKWTKIRINKYLSFFRGKLDNYYNFLEITLNEFWDILKDEEIDFVPLHWDYHLSNLNVNLKGEITGIFDFECAMKGHSLGDIGQTAYWVRFQSNEYQNFQNFLKGYKKRFTENELKLIKGYFLLHLLAVSRTIWFRQKKLAWIIDKHKQMLDEFKQGKF